MFSSRTVFRALWVIPVMLVMLTIHQLKVAYDAGRTWRQGTPARADVVRYERRDMATQSHGVITLSVPQDRGTPIVRTLSMPISLIYRLENLQQVPVRVLPGSGQEIVFEELVRVQQRMALINAGSAGMMALLVAAGLASWLRFLRRRGDPAERAGEEGSGGKREA